MDVLLVVTVLAFLLRVGWPLYTSLVLSSDILTWDEAEQYCHGNNGRLLVLDSEEKWNNLSFNNYAQVNISEGSYWIGMRFNDNVKCEKTHFNTRWVYSGWGRWKDLKEEPNGCPVQKCVKLVNHYMRTSLCSGNNTALCETEFVTSTATGTKADPTTAPPSHFTPTVSSKSLTTNVTDTEVAAASAAPNTREFDVASTVKTSISTSQTVYIEYASSSTVAFSPGVSNATPIIDETHLPSIVSSLKTMPDRTTAPTDFKSVVSTTSIVSSTETTHDPSDPTEFTYMSTLSIVPSTATELTPDPTTDYKPVVSSPSIFSSTETTHDPSSTPTAFTSMSTMSIVSSTELTPDPTTDYKPVLSSPSIFSSTETTHDPSTAPTEFTSVVSLPSIVLSTETTADPTTAPSFHFTSAVASQATTSNTDRATPSEQSTIIKTEKSASTSTTAPDLNTCDKCCIKVNSTLTEHEIEMKQNLLKVQLAVNKTNLSSHRRKLISVYDSRPSSLAMGIVACAILVSVGVFIIIMDAITMYRLMYKRFMNRV